jgi:hypothetical protein
MPIKLVKLIPSAVINCNEHWNLFGEFVHSMGFELSVKYRSQSGLKNRPCSRVGPINYIVHRVMGNALNVPYI